jgi:ribosome-associated protein
MATTETRRLVLAAAQACEDKKAEDTRILELDAVDAGFTDFFLISSGSNERQTQAIADEIEIRLKKEFQTYPNSVEGRRQGEWILMDYVDFVVHIFLTEKRAYYDIERLRKSARTVDLQQLKALLVEKTVVARAKPAKKAIKKAAVKKVALKKSTRPRLRTKKP